MKKGRTPTISDLSALSRDDWENLGAELCSKIFQAHRVEDRLGKGNGMDGWRMCPGGIEGFQHRRLDGRFGDAQVQKLKENIDLAVARCATEMSAPLVGYHVLLNIDLQPGHMGVPSEITMWNNLEKWALTKHNVKLEPHGVTWVLARLKDFPKLRPDMFEDIASDVAEANQKLDKLGDSNEAVLEQLAKLLEASTINSKLKAVLIGLTREARVHFERGLEHEDEEEFLDAITKLEDARRLLELDSVDERLRGHVLLVLCGVKVLVGRLSEGLVDGQKAIAVLNSVDDTKLQRFARGNVAMALYQLQRHKEAQCEFEKLLNEYELDGNMIEVTRTLIHLTELSGNARDAESAAMWADRLKPASHTLVEIHGVDLISIAALGAAANALLAVSRTQERQQRMMTLLKASEILLEVEKMASMVGSPMTGLKARAQRAQSLWYMDNLDSAMTLYEQVLVEADSRGYGQVGAHSRFNRGLIRAEQGMLAEARSELLDARRRYMELGDMPSVADTDIQLHRISPLS